MLADCGAAAALVALVSGDSAEIGPNAFLKMAHRFAGNADLRGVLLERDDLPMVVRQILLSALSDDLKAFVTTRNWLPFAKAERLVAEAERSATVTLAAHCGSDECADLADLLRKTSRLTPNLLLRAVLSGETELFVATLASLAKLPRSRVHSMLGEASTASLAACYQRAGLPATLKTAFMAAIRAVMQARRMAHHTVGMLDLRLVRATLLACAAERDGGDTGVVALLRRYEGEAVRELARIMTSEIMASPAPVIVQDISDLAGDVPSENTDSQNENSNLQECFVPPADQSSDFVVSPMDRLAA